ncbi:UNVERIFIED_CONTAM: Protein phosphatase 1 regulatory subunit 37 [Trichonephila clavipes]
MLVGGAAAIFDMIEYYDTTSHLNISGNKNIGNQGWQACSKMLKRTPCLQYLDASKTSQNEQSLLILGRAFRTGSYLVTLHLENSGIFGRPLVILVAALKLNNTLLELHLGENKICSADGLQLGNLLRSNSTLELLDLRTNNLQDLGICHLIDGLCQQAANCGECLKTLNLSNNGLTRNGMAHVNRALV